MATRRERNVLVDRLEELGASGAASTARGANRLLNTQIQDLGVNNITPIGKSGGKKNLITNKKVQTQGASESGIIRPEFRRSGPSSDIEFTTDIAGGTGIRGAGRKRFSKFLSRERTSQADPTGVSGSGSFPDANLPQEPQGPRPLADLKFKRGDLKFSADQRTKVGGTSRGKAVELNGQAKGTAKLTVTEGKRLTVARRKELAENLATGGAISEQERKRLGIGEFANRRVSPFSEQGINELFGSAANLAKLFSSKEFQQRKARGIQSAAGIKGRRADAKAKTERIKALSGVLDDLSASGGDNEGLMSRIQEQIQDLIAGGGGTSSEVIGKLADQFDDDQIKTILGIIR